MVEEKHYGRILPLSPREDRVKVVFAAIRGGKNRIFLMILLKLGRLGQ